jgi:hypothetical protein
MKIEENIIHCLTFASAFESKRKRKAASGRRQQILQTYKKVSYRREIEMLKFVFCIWSAEIIEEAS